jgi:phosphatidylglycerol:prolipoprotein diacylglycerol transferase
MRQVLFHIPLKAGWLPAGVPLPAFLLACGLAVALCLWLLSRYALRVGVAPEYVRSLAAWSALAGVAAAVIVYALADQFPAGLPIYGFGMMLFLAFLVCIWLAGRRAEREGIAREHIQDLAIWLFIGGLIGARITFLLSERPLPTVDQFMTRFYRIWDGGIVLYGAVLGALVGYAGAYYFLFRKARVSTLKLMDIVAPAVAVGICLGRIGCFLNGCCYGQVACADCAVYPVHFPLTAPAGEELVANGYQSAGFILAPEQDGRGVKVDRVVPGSAAEAAGLRPGDVIVEAGGQEVAVPDDLANYLASLRRLPQNRGKTELVLTVRPAEGQPGQLAFTPRTLGLHPTQLYESVSMFLLFLLLTAYYPFRRRDGEVMVLLMLGYAVHRFLNEMLRADPRPVQFERITSLILFGAGVALYLWILRKPVQYRTEVPVKEEAVAARV